MSIGKRWLGLTKRVKNDVLQDNNFITLWTYALS